MREKQSLATFNSLYKRSGMCFSSRAPIRCILDPKVNTYVAHPVRAHVLAHREADGARRPERQSPDDVQVWKPGKCVIVCDKACSFQDRLGRKDPIERVTVLRAESPRLQGMR